MYINAGAHIHTSLSFKLRVTWNFDTNPSALGLHQQFTHVTSIGFLVRILRGEMVLSSIYSSSR